MDNNPLVEKPLILVKVPLQKCIESIDIVKSLTFLSLEAPEFVISDTRMLLEILKAKIQSDNHSFIDVVVSLDEYGNWRDEPIEISVK